MSLSPSGGINTFNQPSLVEHQQLKFLIMDSPSDINIEQYVKELVRHGTTDIVRACEPHYKTTFVSEAGITCHDCEFKDGDPPPQNISTIFFFVFFSLLEIFFLIFFSSKYKKYIF